MRLCRLLLVAVAVFDGAKGQPTVLHPLAPAVVYPNGPETVRVPGARCPWAGHTADNGLQRINLESA